MNYTDLKDKFPSRDGIYSVKIKTTVGVDRTCLAQWNEKGFVPLDDRLIGEEYIYCWAPMI